METSEDVTNSVLGGLLRRPKLAELLNCHERTIIRREREGMPFIAVGNMRLYDPERVRAWLVSHERTPEASRGRGRPRKAA